ncbi:MAG: MotA/TolQ/ExbB proton channel family protein, partial [Planctomycetes bacterium]|nr:MotA/TolQ/ExbB proton channel family protein [Planctomycetota bacterium]
NVAGITIVAAVAPLLGLLGTVLGIADAFAAVEQTGLGSQEGSEALAAGIKVALYTTIFGLFVAIPATLLAAHLKARARRLVAAIAATVQPTVEALAALPATAKVPDPAAAELGRADGDEPEETHAA